MSSILVFSFLRQVISERVFKRETPTGKRLNLAMRKKRGQDLSLFSHTYSVGVHWNYIAMYSARLAAYLNECVLVLIH